MKNIFLSFIVIISFALFSCEKESELSLNVEEDAIAENDATLESAVESSAYEVDLFTANSETVDALKSETKILFSGRYLLNNAPEVTIETTNGDYPKLITLNYGEGIELTNGHVISGSIIVELSAKPRTSGAVRTVTFSEFNVDSINIAGTRVITFNADLESGFSANVVSDLVITYPNGISFTRKAEKNRTFIEGYETPRVHSDDVLNITGYVNTVCSEGYSFSRNIVEPLVKKGDCRYIVSGIVSLSKNDGIFAELNYGDGTCDDLATITKDGVSKEIHIGKRKRVYSNN